MYIEVPSRASPSVTKRNHWTHFVQVHQEILGEDAVELRLFYKSTPTYFGQVECDALLSKRVVFPRLRQSEREDTMRFPSSRSNSFIKV